jgi:prepilin-type N-terminal cleavage/methylation domain-containing protein
MKVVKLNSGGFGLVEVMVSMAVFAVISLGIISLFLGLVHSAITAKQVAVASADATNQMEYLKSLPYDSLAVAGGSIYAPSPLPATTTKNTDGVTYTIKTAISYVDDSFDGCGSYPTQALKQTYCRNYPPPSGAPAIDTNPADYKIINVTVYDKFNRQLSSVDTQVSARVAETASTTGALFVKLIDPNGNPISGATANVINTTLSPSVNVSDSTDANGIAIFYGLPPDTNNYDYIVTGSKSGYSSLTTIAPAGALQPTYSSQKIFTQASSYATLTLKQQGSASLLIVATNTSGTPLASAKIYLKGGYKKYAPSTDTTYYYDTLTPSDTRPTTDATGQVAVTNLVPGTYIFCGDTGSTSCSVSGTTYYLAAALPYGGVNPFNPITVPTYDPANPPTTTYPFGATNYYQKVTLLLTTSSTFPRINTITPYDPSLTGGTINNFAFTVNGTNLPCSSTASSCSTTVKFLQSSNTYTALCTGSSAGTQLTCAVNLGSAATGSMQMQVTANGNTLTTPVAPPLGGFVVGP